MSKYYKQLYKEHFLVWITLGLSWLLASILPRLALLMGGILYTVVGIIHYKFYKNTK